MSYSLNVLSKLTIKQTECHCTQSHSWKVKNSFHWFCTLCNLLIRGLQKFGSVIELCQLKICIYLKAVYYTVVVHNFNLQEKTTSTVEVTTNFIKKFKAHFEKKLLNY